MLTQTIEAPKKRKITVRGWRRRAIHKFWNMDTERGVNQFSYNEVIKDRWTYYMLTYEYAV